MNNFEWHSIVVTTQSVEYKNNNQKHYVNLDHIDGAEVAFVDYKILLVFAVISCLGVISDQTRVISFFAVILFVALYFATRKLSLQVHAGNVVIKRVITGKDISEAEKFIDSLKEVIEQKSNNYQFKKEA